MKKRLLVVLLVLSLVLVGCGKKDYTDINIYKDLFVNTVNDMDKDFFSRNEKALKDLGIQEYVKQYKDATLEFLDEFLDFIPKEAEALYKELTKSSFNPSAGYLADVQNDLNKTYSYLADDPEELEYVKEDIAEEIINIKVATGVLQQIPEDTVEKLQKKIQKEADEYGIDPSDIIEDALSEYM